MKRLTQPAERARTAAVVVSAATLLSRTAQAAERRLLVFLHSAVKQRALQSELQAALSHVVVTAVGRPADFDRAIRDGQDAVLTLPAVLAAHRMTSQLRGCRAGSSEEKYVLVGADSAPDPTRVDSVGALDLLGREGTTEFVRALLGSRPSVERVTKVEDLLPLLQMQRVRAILLPARLFPDVRSTSRLKLAQRELRTLVGLPAVAVVGPMGNEVLAAVRELPARVSKPLGVDEWR